MREKIRFVRCVSQLGSQGGLKSWVAMVLKQPNKGLIICQLL
jgi:hypothetical protein